MTPAELVALADDATDGPWRYHDDGIIREGQYHLLKVCGSPSNPELAANARLATLAPDLARLAAEMAQWIDIVLAQGAPVTSDYDTGPALLARLEALT